MTYRCTVLRYALSRRWIAWHLFCASLVVGMVAAGIWQWGVAFDSLETPGSDGLDVRNLVYALQWWVFAAFGVWFWFRFLRDQRDAELTELVAAAQAAPEQSGDLAATSGETQDSASSSAPELISLDDSAEDRRARSRGLMREGSVAQSYDSETDVDVEGN